jgi:hypothetical protein
LPVPHRLEGDEVAEPDQESGEDTGRNQPAAERAVGGDRRSRDQRADHDDQHQAHQGLQQDVDEQRAEAGADPGELERQRDVLGRDDRGFAGMDDLLRGAPERRWRE